MPIRYPEFRKPPYEPIRLLRDTKRETTDTMKEKGLKRTKMKGRQRKKGRVGLNSHTIKHRTLVWTPP